MWSWRTGQAQRGSAAYGQCQGKESLLLTLLLRSVLSYCTLFSSRQELLCYWEGSVAVGKQEKNTALEHAEDV